MEELRVVPDGQELDAIGDLRMLVTKQDGTRLVDDEHPIHTLQARVGELPVQRLQLRPARRPGPVADVEVDELDCRSRMAVEHERPIRPVDLKDLPRRSQRTPQLRHSGGAARESEHRPATTRRADGQKTDVPAADLKWKPL